MKRSRLSVSRRRRRNYVAYIILIALLVFAVRQVELQYGVVGEIVRLYRQIENVGEGGVYSNRGRIYDRHYATLAANVDKISVYCRTREIQSPTEDAEVLAEILDKDPKQLRSRLESHSLRSWLAEGISEEQEERLLRADISGIYFDRHPVRYYPQNELAAHLTGFTEDDVGLAGVEHYFDRLLSGALKDEVGLVTLKGTADVVLTVDLKVQRVVQNFLSSLMEDGNVLRASGYVIQSDGGGLVAGSQVPGYNPNRYRDYPRQTFDNMFLQPVPIPEKIKQFLADSAHVFNSTKLDNGLLPWSVSADKSNLANELLLWDWLGLEANWQSDFVSLKGGSKYRYEPVGSAANVSASVPDTASPLQMLVALSSVTGSGKPVRAHVVDKVVDSSGDEIDLDRINLPEKADLNSVAALSREEMMQLIKSQTSTSYKVSHMLHDQQLLERIDENGKSQLFLQELMFVPFTENSENLAMLVVLEKNSYTLPTQNDRTVVSIKNVVKRVSALQHVAESLASIASPRKISREQLVSDKVERDITKSLKPARSMKTSPMPNLSGMSLRKSLQLLEGYSCAIQIEGTGWVKSQYPPAGSSMKDIETCRVTLQPPQSVQREVLENSVSSTNM